MYSLSLLPTLLSASPVVLQTSILRYLIPATFTMLLPSSTSSAHPHWVLLLPIYPVHSFKHSPPWINDAICNLRRMLEKRVQAEEIQTNGQPPQNNFVQYTTNTENSQEMSLFRTTVYQRQQKQPKISTQHH